MLRNFKQWLKSGHNLFVVENPNLETTEFFDSLSVELHELIEDGYELFYWSYSRPNFLQLIFQGGAVRYISLADMKVNGNVAHDPIVKALDLIESYVQPNKDENEKTKAIFFLQGISSYLETTSTPAGNAVIWRLISLLENLKNCPDIKSADGIKKTFFSYKHIVLLGEKFKLSTELLRYVHRISPDKSDSQTLYQRLCSLVTEISQLYLRQKQVKMDVSVSQPAVIERAISGLLLSEISRLAKIHCVTHGRFDGKIFVEEVNNYKQQLFSEYGASFCPPPDVFQFGGLENVKEYLERVSVFFEEEAHDDWGIPYPKGTLLLGLPGTGKTLVAKIAAALWGIPAISMDLGSFREKFIGDSEKAIKNFLELISHQAPCVLVIDEIEKGLAGGPDAGDSGVGARIIGALLKWLNDNQSLVFVVATANNIGTLVTHYPELFRTGRFDEIFFFDLPGQKEREEILKLHLLKGLQELPLTTFFISYLAKKTLLFSGSDIAQLAIYLRQTAYLNAKKGRGNKEVWDVTQEEAEKVIKLIKPAGVQHREVYARLRSDGLKYGLPASTNGLIEENSFLVDPLEIQ